MIAKHDSECSHVIVVMSIDKLFQILAIPLGIFKEAKPVRRGVRNSEYLNSKLLIIFTFILS